jgi:hypothetical protein
MLSVTEGGKRVQPNGIVGGDKDISIGGHGYICLKKRNSQEVHCSEEIHQVVSLVSVLSVREEDLEAGAYMHLGNFKLVKSVQRDLLMIDHSQKSGVDFNVFSHNVVILTQFYTMKMLIAIDNGILNFKNSEYYAKGGKLKVEAEMLLCVCSNPKGSFYFIVLDVEVNLLFKFMMLSVTEGGKRVQPNGIVGGDKDISIGGHGYTNFKKGISQKVHRRVSFCQVCFCIIILSVREDNLEAEAITRQESRKLAKMVIVVFSDFQEGEREFESCSSNNVLAEAGFFSVFLKRFNRARVFVWLMNLLLISEVTFLAGSGISSSDFKERVDIVSVVLIMNFY